MPSIFPRFGGIEEFYPSDSKLSFEQFNYEDLKEKINLLSNLELLEIEGKNNKDFILDILDRDNLIEDFKKLLMNSKKLVSVIMSVHNAEKTIEDCVRSILSQTYENIEFLILDDFSTDKTKEILKKLDTESEKIKLYQNNKNLGLTKSLNILIEESKGEYIARQDSDDTSSINRIETQIKTMETDSLDFCTTKARIKGTNKKIPNISYYIPKKILLKNIKTHLFTVH